MVVLKKLLILIAVLALESVVGLPLLAMVLLIKYMIEKSNQELFWLIVGSFLIGIFYQLSFALTATTVFVAVLLYTHSTSVTNNSGVRLIVSALFASVVVGSMSAVVITPTLIMNLILSSVVSGIIVWKFSMLSSDQKKITYEMKALEYKDYTS